MGGLGPCAVAGKNNAEGLQRTVCCRWCLGFQLRQATPMHRSQLCADRVSGHTISPMRMAREARQLVRKVSGAMSIRFARCQRVVIPCAVRRPRSSLDFAATRNSRKAPQTLALSRADHGRRRNRFDDHPRDLQLATEIAHCVARAPACKNYVEVRLTALGSEPRNSSISASKRSSPERSCDLCIGVYGELCIATLKRHSLS